MRQKYLERPKDTLGLGKAMSLRQKGLALDEEAARLPTATSGKPKQRVVELGMPLQCLPRCPHVF